LNLRAQIQVLQAITDLANGITVNPGVIGGGTCSNVISAEAWVDIDVRVARKQDTAKVDRALRSLRPFDKACRLTMSGGMNRPPMERSKGTVALFRAPQELAAGIGMRLKEAATAVDPMELYCGLGIPTLDGHGRSGRGAHARTSICAASILCPARPCLPPC